MRPHEKRGNDGHDRGSSRSGGDQGGHRHYRHHEGSSSGHRHQLGRSGSDRDHHHSSSKRHRTRSAIQKVRADNSLANHSHKHANEKKLGALHGASPVHETASHTSVEAACVWSDCHFGGASQCFAGPSGCKDLDEFGMLRNVSSLLVGKGFKIRLFSNVACKGSWIEVVRWDMGLHAVPCLALYNYNLDGVDMNWNDHAQSMKVCDSGKEC